MAEDDRLAGYIEVHDRIAAFIEKYPEGSMAGSFEVRELGDQLVIIYHAIAYRSPTDERPGHGYASEPVPGKTPFTKDSELMNCETSAWGRALAAIGIKVHDGVASANEVRARRTDDERPKGFASDKQANMLKRCLRDRKAKDPENIVAWLEASFDGSRGGGISRAIDRLMDKNDETVVDDLQSLATAWHAEQSDIPADDADLPDEVDRPSFSDSADEPLDLTRDD